MTDGLYNVPAERWVLYSLLMGDQPFMDACATLAPRHFYRELHGELYGALQAAYKQTGTGGLPVVLDALTATTRPEEYDRACQYAADLLSALHVELTAYHPVCLSPTYLKHMAGIVVKLYERRERVRSASKSVQEAWAGKRERIDL